MSIESVTNHGTFGVRSEGGERNNNIKIWRNYRGGTKRDYEST